MYINTVVSSISISASATWRMSDFSFFIIYHIHMLFTFINIFRIYFLFFWNFLGFWFLDCIFFRRITVCFVVACCVFEVFTDSNIYFKSAKIGKQTNARTCSTFLYVAYLYVRFKLFLRVCVCMCGNAPCKYVLRLSCAPAINLNYCRSS